MGEMIQFKRPDGKNCPGYLATPKAGSSAPGFVVIQEWWGLNDQIKNTADRLVRNNAPGFSDYRQTTSFVLPAFQHDHVIPELNSQGDVSAGDAIHTFGQFFRLHGWRRRRTTRRPASARCCSGAGWRSCPWRTTPASLRCWRLQ